MDGPQVETGVAESGLQTATGAQVKEPVGAAAVRTRTHTSTHSHTSADAQLSISYGHQTWRAQRTALLFGEYKVAEKTRAAVDDVAGVDGQALHRHRRVGVRNARKAEWAVDRGARVRQRLALRDGGALIDVVAQALLAGVENLGADAVGRADGVGAGVGDDAFRLFLALVDAFVDWRLSAALSRKRERHSLAFRVPGAGAFFVLPVGRPARWSRRVLQGSRRCSRWQEREG